MTKQKFGMALAIAVVTVTSSLLFAADPVTWHVNLTTDPSNRDSNKGVVGWDLKRYEPLLSRMKAANGEVYAKL